MAEKHPHGSTPFRIAVRDEGEHVNAYFARTGTMQNAELVLSIKRRVLEDDPQLRESFFAFMQLLAASMVMKRTGQGVSGIDVSPGPEHEKAGHA